MPEIVTLTALPTPEAFNGAAYRIEGPIAERLSGVGNVVLGFVSPDCMELEALNPDQATHADLLEAFNQEGYQIDFGVGAPTNFVRFRQPIAPEIYGPTLRDYVNFVGKHQTTI